MSCNLLSIYLKDIVIFSKTCLTLTIFRGKIFRNICLVIRIYNEFPGQGCALFLDRAYMSPGNIPLSSLSIFSDFYMEKVMPWR
jgi:hypothetical protein